ncbi:unnamed protein product [Leuciscus chuanchicus]
MKVFWAKLLIHGEEPPDLSNDPEYSQRLQYLGDKQQNCNIRLSHVTLKDSHMYYFRFITDKDKWIGKPGVTLTVTDLQVESPERVTEGDSVNLRCKSSCALTDRATFIWYRNSQPLTERRDRNNELLLQSVRREDSGRYSCAVDGHTHISPAVQLNVMYSPRSVSVSISPSDVIVEGDSVTLNCISDSNPPAEISWFKGGTFVGSGRIYSISKISSDDSGEYKCKSINEHGEKYSDTVTLNVMYPPRNVSVLMSGSGVIVEGDSVTLNCISDSNPPAEISWFKGGTFVGSGRIYNISKISSDDSGEYKCKSINEHGEKYSDTVTLNVMYPPRNVSVLMSGSGLIVEGDSVTLNCISDSNPPALNFSWFKGGTIVGSGRIYSISKISSDDSGEYKCKSINERGEKYSDTVTLNVMYPPRNVSVLMSGSGVIVEGDSVTLNCISDSNPPALNFSWFKGGTFVGSGRIYNISKISSDDSGEYKCKSINEHGEKYSDTVTLNVMYPPRNVSVSISPSGVIVEGDSVTLNCISDSNPPALNFSWFKGGTFVGSGRIYNISKISSDDSGEYKCKSINEHGEKYSDTVTLNVMYPPRNVSVLMSGSGLIVEGDSVTLNCISDSNPPAEISWFKGGTIVGSGRIYSISKISSDDSGEYKCKSINERGEKYSDTVTLNVMYPPRNVSVLMSGSGVIVEGDSVTLNCISDSNPPAEISWIKGGTFVGSGRIYNISKISSDDSGEYKCKSINEHGEKYSETVTLNVMYPPRNVSVSISPSGVIVEGDSVTLNCISDSNPPALNFSWFKGGTIVGSGRIYNISKISSDDSGEYKCKSINEHGEKYSDTVTLNVMYPPRNVSVSISPSDVIVEGDSVTLNCISDSNPPALNFSWFKGGTFVGSERIYNISKISSDDSGEYKCKSINERGEKYSDTVSLNVMYPPRNVSVSISPSGVIVEGDSVTLNCISDSNPPALNFSWFKGGTFVGSGRIYSISKISSDDSGEYKCKSINERGEKYSDTVTLNVMYPPRNVSVLMSGSGVIVEGDSVTLNCISDSNPPALNFSWFKGGTIVGSGRIYSISKISSDDSGEYKCKSINERGEKYSDTVTLNVMYPPRNVSVLMSGSGVIVEGDSVTLNCISDSNPPAEISWIKGGTFVGSGRIYNISKISSDDSGEYKCKSINEHGEKYSETVTLNVMYPPRNVSVSISPSGVIVEGDSVTLNCISDSNPPALNFSWFKGGTIVGSGRIYNISKISSDDSGEYKCKSINEHGEKYSDTVTLNVMYPPRNVSVSISPSDVIVEGDSVTLNCISDSNPPALNFSWFKGGTFVGSERIYNISKISSDDSGEYKCKSINERGEKYSDTVSLNVMYPPRNVSVSISPSGVIVEGDSVTLNCISDSNPPALNFSWFKGGTFVGSGRIYSISKISSDDSGEYKCKSINERGEKYSDTVTLNVMYPPRNVSVLMSGSGVIVEGDSVTLNCISDSNPPAEISWFKGGTFVGSGRIYNISKISSDDSGEYKCKSINEHGEKYSETVTLNVMYPPRNVSVSISPSGVIVEGDSVTLNCISDSNPPALNFSWFKGGTIVGSGRIYNISKISSDDSGEYKCKSINEHGEKYSDTVTLNVMYPPRNVSVSISPSDVIVEGDSVTLNCISDSNPPALNFSWFKGGTFVGSGRIYNISKISSDDSGEYKCKSINEHGEKYSDTVTLNVMYPPRNVSVLMSGSGVIVEGDSVTLNCISDSNPPALNFSWFKGGTIVGSGRIYNISKISSDDSGEYKCKSINERGEKYSDTVTLNVMYPPRNVSVSISPSGVIVEGDSVTLNCISDSNPPALNFSWFKGGTFVGSERIYNISKISSDDSGEYKCKSINERGEKYSDTVTLNVMYPPRNVSVLMSGSGVIVEGDSVTLNCISDSNPPALNFSWFKGGTFVGSGRIYNISKISSDDSGEYKCKSINEHGEKYSDTVTLNVMYPPRNVSVLMSGSGVIVEGDSVTLNCISDSNPPALNFSWFKGGTFVGSGRIYSISKISSDDSGEYKCKSINEHGEKYSDTVTLNVMYPPRNVSVLMSGSGVIVEGYSVTLNCISDSNPPAEISWIKGGTFVGSGRIYNISKISSDDSGEYKCKSINEHGEKYSDTVTLNVMYPPRNVSVLMSGSGVIVEGDSVTLNCISDSNPPALNFSWFKENETSAVGSGQSFSALQSGHFYCQAHNQHGSQRSDAVTVTVKEVAVFMVGPSVTLDKIPRLVTTNCSVDIDLIGIAKNNNETRSAAVAFMSYNTMENLLKPDFFNPSTDTIKTMMSTVISVTLLKTTNAKLTKPINFTFKHISEFEPGSSLSCVYWNISEWIVDGCSVLKTNSSYTVCSCVHLSTFAVIMQTSRPSESDSKLDVLNLVCVIVGLVFFSLALLTFALCQWSPGVNNVARINLCVSLLLAHLLFLLTQQFLSLIRPHQVLCAVIAGVLHFLFLSGFVWMFIEAVLLFICVKNLSQISSKRRGVLRSGFLCVIGYTVALVVVAVSAGVDPKGYGSEQCWIKMDKGFIWSFQGPVCVILALNMILFIYIIISLTSTLKNLNAEVSHMKQTK